MYDILQLISWLRDNPGMEVELRFLEEDSLWLLRVTDPKIVPSSAYFRIREESLAKLFDILKGLEDVQLD